MSLHHLVVQQHHIALLPAQPHVDGFAHAADLVQRRCVVIRPAELQNLIIQKLVTSRAVYPPQTETQKGSYLVVQLG